MDVNKALGELYAEKRRLDSIIESLEFELKARSPGRELVKRQKRAERRNVSSAPEFGDKCLHAGFDSNGAKPPNWQNP